MRLIRTFVAAWTREMPNSRRRLVSALPIVVSLMLETRRLPSAHSRRSRDLRGPQESRKSSVAIEWTLERCEFGATKKCSCEDVRWMVQVLKALAYQVRY